MSVEPPVSSNENPEIPAESGQRRQGKRGVVLEVLAGTLLTVAILGTLIGYFFGTSLSNAFTSQAELTIETDAAAESSLIVLARNGQGMEFVIRPAMKKTITIPAGEYSLTLIGKKPGCPSRLTTQRLELKRGRSGTVRIASGPGEEAGP